MRLLQNLLLVVGMTAVGTVVGFLALVSFVALIQQPRGEPWQRGFGQYLGGLFCGAPFGAVAGLVASICFIRAQELHRTWSVFVWLGIVTGLAAGAVMSFSWSAASGLGGWGTILLTLAGGTAGGVLARGGVALIASAGSETRAQRPAKRAQRLTS